MLIELFNITDGVTNFDLWSFDSKSKKLFPVFNDTGSSETISEESFFTPKRLKAISTQTIDNSSFIVFSKILNHKLYRDLLVKHIRNIKNDKKLFASIIAKYDHIKSVLKYNDLERHKKRWTLDDNAHREDQYQFGPPRKIIAQFDNFEEDFKKRWNKNLKLLTQNLKSIEHTTKK